MPLSIARRFCEAFPLQAVVLHGLPRAMRVQQLWHPRVHGDAAHRWLRAEVHAAASSPT
jgi:hypothetical protein